MRGSILLITGEFAKEGYVLVYDNEEVNIYDTFTTDIEINAKAILKGHSIEKQGCGTSRSKKRRKMKQPTF